MWRFGQKENHVWNNPYVRFAPPLPCGCNLVIERPSKITYRSWLDLDFSLTMNVWKKSGNKKTDFTLYQLILFVVGLGIDGWWLDVVEFVWWLFLSAVTFDAPNVQFWHWNLATDTNRHQSSLCWLISGPQKKTYSPVFEKLRTVFLKFWVNEITFYFYILDYRKKGKNWSIVQVILKVFYNV